MKGKGKPVGSASRPLNKQENSSYLMLLFSSLVLSLSGCLLNLRRLLLAGLLLWYGLFRWLFSSWLLRPSAPGWAKKDIFLLKASGAPPFLAWESSSRDSPLTIYIYIYIYIYVRVVPAQGSRQSSPRRSAFQRRRPQKGDPSPVQVTRRLLGTRTLSSTWVRYISCLRLRATAKGCKQTN